MTEDQRHTLYALRAAIREFIRVFGDSPTAGALLDLTDCYCRCKGFPFAMKATVCNVCGGEGHCSCQGDSDTWIRNPGAY